jgi:general secretion pathway protein H
MEADRLARLLAIAREEALLRAAPVRLDSDLDGFQFLVWRDRRWQRIDEDPLLRARRWEAPTRILIERADGGSVIEFGRESLDAPFRIQLQRERATAYIESNGLGQFAVR